MKLLVPMAALLVASSSSAADIEPFSPHQQTPTPEDARFVIIQSPLAAKWTFRLDRFTGNICQLVKTSGDGVTWEEMAVVGRVSIAKPQKARFQIFTSGMASRFTFLIDTESGKTWVLTTVSSPRPDGTTSEMIVWNPFED